MPISDLFRKSATARDTAGVLPVTHIVVGLGNPGNKYFNTRHNTGFLCMDYLSQKYFADVKKIKFKALVGETVICGKRVLLMKPQTLMNASGDAVAEAAAFYKIPPENVIVMCDDINLDVGRMRVRAKGSDGGQKGLRSIILRLGSDEFPRIRMGVGMKPTPEWDLADWVLSEFSKDDQKKLFECFDYACQGIEKLISGDIDGAMQLCNSKK